MKIITYQSATAPAAQRWLARFLIDKHFLPTFVSAPTEEGVIAAAQKFWDDERARLNRSGDKRTPDQSIIERVGAPDPVRAGNDEQIDLEDAIAAAASPEPIDLLADLLG